MCDEDPFRGSSSKQVALVQGGWRGFGDRSADERAAFMKVWELIGLTEPGGDGAAETPYVDRLLEALSLRRLLSRYFGSLSDGERRRVDLGRKLRERKSVVLLDEATTDLDLLARKKVMDFIKAEAVTVVNATHVFDGLESWATHLLHLHEGRVAHFEQVSPQEPPPWDESSGLFGLVARWVGDAAAAPPPAASASAAPTETGDNTVDVNNLRFSYAPGSPCALRLDRLLLPIGCRCVLVGLNGSGKSTFLTIAAGRRMVANSEVKVLGLRAFYEHAKLDPMVTLLSSEWKRQVSEISAGKSVTFPELANGFIQELVSAGLDMAMLSGRMLRLIQMLSIDPTKPLGALSDGGMRRVQIALKLLRPSKLLLVDEVTADLDVPARAALLAFLREEALAGCSIVYCTHIFDGLGGWPTHVLRLRPGGHDGELIPFVEAGASAATLVPSICKMLEDDSQLSPVAADPASAAATSGEAALPEGWGSRGNTQAGAFGDYAWNAEKGPEDAWSFGSVAPKPQNVIPGQTSSGSGAPGPQFPGASSPFPAPLPTLGGAAPQPQGYPVASSTNSPMECPFGAGRSNQTPLEELMRRGAVQQSPSLR